MRAEVGATSVNDTQNLPGLYRFFAGGDVSVRGFAIGELSPLTVLPSGVVVRVGGRHLVTGSVELSRDLPRNTGIAGFFDVGNAIDRFGDPLAYSAGLGFRWRLPGVTFGVDVAQALRAPGYDKLPGLRVHLNITQRL
jgi:translocation and assembly module TamA